MKLNSNTCIRGEKVILVPYRDHHVPKYHEWMASKEIQELTSSEPLTLPEEYEMRSKWENDKDKLTFIILRRDIYDECENQSLEKTQIEIQSMVGDVNLFVNESEEINDMSVKCGELEIMIAEKSNRSLGFGQEAIKLMIYYCLNYLTDISIFIVKISEDNTASIKMFERKFGFKQYDHIRVFKQVCLKLTIDESYFSNKNQNEDFFKFEKNHQLQLNTNY